MQGQAAETAAEKRGAIGSGCPPGKLRDIKRCLEFRVLSQIRRLCALPRELSGPLGPPPIQSRQARDLLSADSAPGRVCRPGSADRGWGAPEARPDSAQKCSRR